MLQSARIRHKPPSQVTRQNTHLQNSHSSTCRRLSGACHRKIRREWMIERISFRLNTIDANENTGEKCFGANSLERFHRVDWFLTSNAPSYEPLFFVGTYSNCTRTQHTHRRSLSLAHRTKRKRVEYRQRPAISPPIELGTLLRLCSLCKLMTLRQTCRVFVERQRFDHVK